MLFCDETKTWLWLTKGVLRSKIRQYASAYGEVISFDVKGNRVAVLVESPKGKRRVELLDAGFKVVCNWPTSPEATNVQLSPLNDNAVVELGDGIELLDLSTGTSICDEGKLAPIYLGDGALVLMCDEGTKVEFWRDDDSQPFRTLKRKDICPADIVALCSASSAVFVLDSNGSVFRVSTDGAVSLVASIEAPPDEDLEHKLFVVEQAAMTVIAVSYSEKIVVNSSEVRTFALPSKPLGMHVVDGVLVVAAEQKGADPHSHVLAPFAAPRLGHFLRAQRAASTSVAAPPPAFGPKAPNAPSSTAFSKGPTAAPAFKSAFGSGAAAPAAPAEAKKTDAPAFALGKGPATAATKSPFGAAPAASAEKKADAPSSTAFGKGPAAAPAFKSAFGTGAAAPTAPTSDAAKQASPSPSVGAPAAAGAGVEQELVWRCEKCNKPKDLRGDHLKGKVEVRSDCWPCAKKTTFRAQVRKAGEAIEPAQGGGGAASPALAVSGPSATPAGKSAFVTAAAAPPAPAEAKQAEAPSSTAFSKGPAAAPAFKSAFGTAAAPATAEAKKADAPSSTAFSKGPEAAPASLVVPAANATAATTPPPSAAPAAPASPDVERGHIASSVQTEADQSRVRVFVAPLLSRPTRFLNLCGTLRASVQSVTESAQQLQLTLADASKNLTCVEEFVALREALVQQAEALSDAREKLRSSQAKLEVSERAEEQLREQLASQTAVLDAKTRDLATLKARLGGLEEKVRDLEAASNATSPTVARRIAQEGRDRGLCPPSSQPLDDLVRKFNLKR